jgi:hypothetical protein
MNGAGADYVRACSFSDILILLSSRIVCGAVKMFEYFLSPIVNDFSIWIYRMIKYNFYLKNWKKFLKFLKI